MDMPRGLVRPRWGAPIASPRW